VPRLRTVGGGKNAHFHGFVPRIAHLAGTVVAAVTTLEVDGEEVVGNGGGNRRRFYDWQRNVENECRTLWRYVERFRT